LINDNFIKGTHFVTWDGTDHIGTPVSSGIYFYRVISDTHTATKKMLLLK
jgi:flagellar hook assembly protein FlgD